MTNEQGLSLPETMVTNEDALEAFRMLENPIFQIYQPKNTLSLHINCSYDQACKNINTIRQFIEQQTKGLNQ
jgi:hypothetical protein